MPVPETEKEILVHQPASLNETPDSADPQKKAAPPARRVLRPSAEAPLSDVIRHQPASGAPPARDEQRQPKQQAAPSAAAAAEASANAEFAAAAARARAAVNQQRPDTVAKKATPQVPTQRPPKRRSAAASPAAASQEPVRPAPVQPAPTRAAPTQAAPTQAAPTQAAPTQAAPTQASLGVARPTQASEPRAPIPARAAAAPSPSVAPAAPRPAPNPTQTAAVEPAAAVPARERAQVLAEPQTIPQVQADPATRPHRESGKTFLLHTHGLKKVYDGRAVVNGVEVTVRPSEIVGLLGPNGAGKTTTFYMIVGLIQPNGGSVTFDGKDATHQPMYRRARLGMGYLPQEESIFRKLSVEDNILADMETQNVARSERRDRCHELMKRFGIERLAKNEAITLSGGEKRRLTIARSLVTNPKLLMLDEPFSGVDPIAVGEIQEIVRSLREQGLAILITDHNVRETLDIVDRAYLLFEGRVEREGTRDFLINDPLSRQLYLGERFSM